MPRPEFKPEPLVSMRKRLPEAVRSPVDQAAVRAGRGSPPGLLRAHVFDFRQGMRLIVSLEKGVGVLVSASAEDGSPEHRRIADDLEDLPTAEAMDRFIARAAEAWRRLAGPDAELRFLGLSRNKGAPLWSVDPAKIR